MAGRIRTLKPEWLEDEALAKQPDHVRLLSVVLILIANDHGRGRANPAYIRSQAYMYASEADDTAAHESSHESLRKVREGLMRLSGIGFIRVYKVDSQTYFQICNWTKHQKVQHPGRDLIPAPKSNENEEIEDSHESLTNTPESLTKVPESLTPDHRSSIIDHRSSCSASNDANDNRPSGAREARTTKSQKLDVLECELGPTELQTANAIANDETLSSIVQRPNTLAKDLVRLGPGINVAQQVSNAGAWLRANPSKAKKNGNRFLVNWIVRAQERNGGRQPIEQGNEPLPLPKPKAIAPPPSGSLGGV